MNIWKRKILILLVVLSVLSLVFSACDLINNEKGKDKDKTTDADRITICHRTGSKKNHINRSQSQRMQLQATIHRMKAISSLRQQMDVRKNNAGFSQNRALLACGTNWDEIENKWIEFGERIAVRVFFLLPSRVHAYAHVGVHRSSGKALDES